LTPVDADRPILIQGMVWGACGFAGLAGGASFALGVGSPLRQIGILLGAALIGAGLGAMVAGGAGMASRGFFRMLFAAGGLPSRPGFSYQESLVARGRCREAARAYRDHLVTHPADHDARLALGALLAGPLADPAGAEQVYLEVRAAGARGRHEMLASQALIDLYAATGQRGRHMTELARFADRYRGTGAGRAARHALEEMKGTGG
jgi:hypothetical protein